LLFLSLLINSCAKPYTKVDPLTKTEKSRIHKIGIVSKTEGDFDIEIYEALESPQFSYGGSLLLFLVDLGIAYGRYHCDESIDYPYFGRMLAGSVHIFPVRIVSNNLRFTFLQRLNLSAVFFFLLLSPFVATLFLSALFVGDIKAFLDSRFYIEVSYI